MKIYLLIIGFLFSTSLTFDLKAQISIPQGLSLDSVTMDYFHSINKIQSFHCYKPTTYNPLTSPVIFAIHGVGGNGAIIIGDLIDIAERRQALIIAPNFAQSGFTGLSYHQEPTYLYVDYDKSCYVLGSSTEILSVIYKHVLQRENRTSIPSYLVGFSAGAQFVSRFMWLRQAYPDSIPIQMAVSANAYSYSFPTDTFLGTTMYWLCGTVMPTQFGPSDCFEVSNFYSWNCNEHIIQYYNENYGVLIGTADVSPIFNMGCFAITGNNRYERAQTFYNFADSNAITRGTTLNWEYREVPGVGHDQNAMLNNKANPNDSSTIAETLLFDTPYNQVVFNSPIASFYANVLNVNVNDTVTFINTSVNTSTYLWDFGDSTTSQVMNPTHTYSTAGYYAVQLLAMNSNGCDNWAVKNYYINVTDPTNTVELSEKEEFSIYPNPTSDLITIKFNDKVESRYFLLHDATGRIVLQKLINNSLTIDISNIPPGIYFYEVRETQGAKVFGKLVKI